MENLTASFRSPADREQAAEALRKQGVVDLQFESGTAEKAFSPSALAMSRGETDSGSHGSWTMQILVESSRRRQAEDTVVHFGGQY
ncbi:hypothetical protein [Paenibacillus mucilaginosus]|uniref:SPOR domain-containing protein n=2 Tax=Paenibacillus mucilaginosus TaxID=61624 RepID=H6NIX5_9BACL|nr:hypothetical protein [Paenibacillus mucilaginosus]AEI46430.1 hypothetical protein KNP414_07945 [Paenibacillus mucilaginosus KNP414]AFC34025.1 hypothetical protein PM3016_7459 [Paenibacillus mucilaginosus 3016]MCG7213464.1 hypothetical protein [Paenibacillus mucilaginosus]WDM27717.1 hypothetical protein KCX80_36185 [Paenibacillus mucilaginosus]WFA22390.1 hypothetical protein ERY13_37085 [Paenibacillus mucilaginosus]